MSTAPPPDIPGLVYVQPVGSGGYADVFLYEQQMPRMPVAVKVLKGEGLTASLRRQFTDEADTMAQLADHPYIVQVFRAETSSDGRPYLVMKYYPPPNLAMRARNQRFTVEEVLRTGIQLASAVETAHRAGIIHRDIKPANVLVSQYGAPGLTDFGIAGRGGALEEDSDDVGVSVPWAPPEVLFGQSSGDARADVYSLSATLWQLLVGRSPFEVPGGDNTAYALMPRIRSTRVPSSGRADVPTSLERLLAQAMAKDPANRPATAHEFARALQEIEQEQRFPRTAIVVLDEQGHTTLADQSSGGDAEDESDRTRVRAPQSVQAQRAPAAPAYRPPPSPHLSGGSSISPAPITQIASSTRPRMVGASQASPTFTDGEVEEGTVRVDRGRTRTAGTTGTESTAEAASESAPVESRSISGGALLGVMGVLVLALGGVVIWALGRDDAKTDNPQDHKTVAVQSDDPVLNLPETPVISAQGLPGAVKFTWTYAGREKADAYRLRVARDVNALGDTNYTVERATSKVVRAKAGTTLCAQVQVNRGGDVTPLSGAKCERAG